MLGMLNAPNAYAMGLGHDCDIGDDECSLDARNGTWTFPKGMMCDTTNAPQTHKRTCAFHRLLFPGEE